MMLAFRMRAFRSPMSDIPQHGAVTEIFLPRVVAQLHRDGFEGLVRVGDDSTQRTLYFKGGEIASATSNDDADRLQSILIREGRLTLPQVDMARSRQQPGGALAKTLIEMGFLNASELLDCARRQARQILAACFALDRGTFQIEPGPLSPRITVMGLATRRMIFEALLDVGDRQRIVREMGSMESVYRPTADASARRSALQLDPETDALAGRIDGSLSLRDLSSKSSLDDFTLSKTILALEILGVAERVDTPDETPAAGRVIPVDSRPESPANDSPGPLFANPVAPPPHDVEPTDIGQTAEPAEFAPAPAPVARAARMDETDDAAVPDAPEPTDPVDTVDEPEAATPPFAHDELPAFALPTTETPEWNVDPRTGEKIHEGPIEMTFDGLVRAHDKPPSGSGRLIGITVGVVVIVVIGFFFLVPG